MKQRCSGCGKPSLPVTLGQTDLCAACTHEASAFLDKFARGESIDGHVDTVAALLIGFGLACAAFGLACAMGAGRDILGALPA